jgi:hypothetical protein
MKAALYWCYGDSEPVDVPNIEVPLPKSNEVHLPVRAAALGGRARRMPLVRPFASRKCPLY